MFDRNNTLSDRAFENILQCIREICGEGFFGTIDPEWTGRKVYIPTHPKPHHTICKIMPLDQVVRLAEIHNGVAFEVPTARGLRLRDQIADRLQAGDSFSSITSELQCSRRHVSNVKRELGAPKAAGVL